MTASELVRALEEYYGKTYRLVIRNELLVLAHEMRGSAERKAVYQDCVRGFARQPVTSEVNISLQGVRERYVKKLIEQSYEQDGLPDEGELCKPCSGTGWIQELDTNTGYTYSRRCRFCR